MDKRVHQVRLAQWSQRIIDRKNSGLTIAQWCDQNGFTKDAYHYWQKGSVPPLLMQQVLI